jgi:malate dehydrogenase (oxaloacetate-decarboxylating)
MDDWEVFPKEAAAVAMKAIEQGLARIETTYEKEFERASHIIKRSRDMTKRMMEEGFIPEPPEDSGDNPEIDLETVKAAY